MAPARKNTVSRNALPAARCAPRRVGLLGGSFNPVHDGHLHASRLALRRLRLDEVWWLVSPQNPLKAAAGMAPLADRLAAARALAGDARIRVTDIEDRLATRFSVDTIAALHRRYPRTRFVWLIGADIMDQLPKWRRWGAFFRRVAIAVLARPPYSFNALASCAAHRFARFRIGERDAGSLAGRKPPAWVFLHGKAHPASATALRKNRGVNRSNGRPE